MNRVASTDCVTAVVVVVVAAAAVVVVFFWFGLVAVGILVFY